jgi:hypothetical protein
MPFTEDLNDVIHDFNPEDEVQQPSNQPPRMGSFDQYSEVVVKYVRASMIESSNKLAEYNQDHILGLLLKVADDEGVSPWSVWRSWMRRHLIPTMEMTKNSHDKEVLRRRLVDLLGYVFMALELVEVSEMEGYDKAWENFRSMSTSAPR